MTVEDPVEYRLGEKIVQVQINEKAGMTFPAALRSILRQDPDVILIGEIRDQETAQIAVQASLTGHLVLSTLHTNDAPNTVTRLVDIGMEAYKIGAALRGVVAQRLVRRLCPTCKIADPDPLPRKLLKHVDGAAPRFKAVGCGDCGQTGYLGRFAIVEILVMNPTIERLVISGATADHIAAAARASGMRSLFESAMLQVVSGTTSLEEALRVTDPPREDFGAAPSAPLAGAPVPAAAAAAGPRAQAAPHSPDASRGDPSTVGSRSVFPGLRAPGRRRTSGPEIRVDSERLGGIAGR